MPLVLLVWGLIIYKVYAMLNDPETPDTSVVVKPSITKAEIKIENYDLLLNYRDPFLNKQELRTLNPKKIKSNSKSSITIDKIKKGPAVEWNIAYSGMVYNQNTREKIALISINNENFIVKEGERREGFLIKTILEDSIKIQFNSDHRYIKRQ